MREDVGRGSPDSFGPGASAQSAVGDEEPDASFVDLGRVLIVDSDLDFVRTIGEALRDTGYEPSGFATGLEAFDALKERDFDVAIVACRLPDVDGVAFLRNLRESHPVMVGILMIEGAPAASVSELVRASTAFDCVRKPVTAAELVPILDRAIEVRSLRGENQRLRESLSIYEFADSPSGPRDVPQILEAVAKAALRLVDADEVSIMLPTANGEELELAVARGPDADRLIGRHVPIDEGVVGWVARHRERLVIRGGMAIDRAAGIESRAEPSVDILLPMVFDERLIGVMRVGGPRGQRQFTPGQIEALSVIANDAASVVDLASRFAQAREAEEMFRAIFENAPVGIYQSTPEGRYLLANPTLAQILGYATADALISEITDIGRQLYVDPERWVALQRQLSEGSDVREFESQIRRRDGQNIWVSENARLVRRARDDEPIRDGTMEDITARKVAEIESESNQVALRENQRTLEDSLAQVKQLQPQIIQQERLQALGQMASGVAHDFNNDLAMIVGFSELLLKRPENLANPEKIRSYLQMIRAVVGDAAKVVDRLHAFSRHRDENEVFVPINLNELVEQCLVQTQPRWRNQTPAGVTIQVETNLQPIPPVSGNAADLRDAVTILILNAVDAMPQGGTLTIRTRLDGQRARLEVSDTGTGMSDEERQRSFEPFFTTKGERGTGLELAMVYGTIQRHEGSIEIETAPGKGTTFVIQLPVPRSEATGPPPVAPEVERAAGPLHVLLVEDEAPLLRTLAEFLSIERHVVESAVNGRDGWEKFRATRLRGDPGTAFDIVVTDLEMPGMSGDQLAAAIRKLDPEMPIVLLTGLGEMLRASAEKPEGVDLVLAKPVSMATLQRAVAQVARRRAHGSSVTPQPPSETDKDKPLSGA